jgi:hypothetical protein
LGGSPQVKLLPDLSSLHHFRHFSKRVLVVQCSNPTLPIAPIPGST